MDNTKNITRFEKTAFYFFIYACLGWILEEIYCIMETHTFTNRGFLFGPLCPIYGYGALILIIFFRKYKKNPIKVFFLAAIIFSIFEYITDFFLEALFASRWWDYTGFFLNLNGRITFSFSIVWGLGSFIFIRFIHPFVTKLLGKILVKVPFKFQHIFIRILLSTMFIDTFISSLVYLNIF